ncbi:MAG: lipoyl(octanoyl) transferase LipB [Elusimicrobia bacterium]|nr:lipoyl(octanoyl) transferase LipB [Elusimicrobiota bacterium]
MLARMLGVKDYKEAWDLQKDLVLQRLGGAIGDTLLLLEHPPVYTRGISSRALPPLGLPYPLYDVERGGDITYHGPGQLVGYPIVRLEERGLNPRSYLRALESILIESLRPLGIAGKTLKGFTGVWSGDKKVASIGVAVKSGVSYHGFALNIHCDLGPFHRIYPCNLEPEQLGTLQGALGRTLRFEDVQERIARSFLEFFPPLPPAATPRTRGRRLAPKPTL